MKTLEDEIRHILDYDSEETVALTFKTKARLVKNIISTVESCYSSEEKPVEQKSAEEILAILKRNITQDYYTEWTHEEPHVRSKIIGFDKAVEELASRFKQPVEQLTDEDIKIWAIKDIGNLFTPSDIGPVLDVAINARIKGAKAMRDGKINNKSK